MTLSPAHARLAYVLAWVVVVGAQLGLLSYFGGEYLLSERAYAGLDFDTHIGQTWRVLEGLEQVGRTWVYDVSLLAGVPNGVIFDADNKGWTMFTYAGTLLGLSKARAFNLFILLTHLAVVPVVFWGARLLRLERWAALLAAAFAVAYWNFDSWAHWCWYVGMIAYALASFFFLLPLGCFYRWCDERRPVWMIGSAITLAAAHLIHPYSFIILVFPMAVLYVRAFRSLRKVEHAQVLAMVLVTLAVNGYWLHNAALFWHYIVDSSLFAETGLQSAVADLFGLLREPAATGIIAKLTAFRTMLLVGGLLGAFVWWRSKDERVLPLGGALVVLIAVAYLGTYTFLAHTQPYRNLMPAGFLGAILLAALVQRGVNSGVFATLSAGGRLALGFLMLPTGLFLTSDVLYYAVDDLPKPSPLPNGEPVELSALGFKPHATYGYGDWHLDPLVEWVEEKDDGNHRFLVEGWSWGEQLAWKTNAQVMGGFIWRNLDHSWSNFFRQKPGGMARPEDVRAYLRRYAVGWVIINTPRERAPWWDTIPALELVKEVPPIRLYRVKEPTALIAKNRGRVRASTNRIEVYDTDPKAPIVLRYHWMETLACTPDCEILRHPVKGDEVGFMRIPAPHPKDILIYNTYRFEPADM